MSMTTATKKVISFVKVAIEIIYIIQIDKSGKGFLGQNEFVLGILFENKVEMK